MSSAQTVVEIFTSCLHVRKYLHGCMHRAKPVSEMKRSGIERHCALSSTLKAGCIGCRHCALSGTRETCRGNRRWHCALAGILRGAAGVHEQ